MAQRDDTNTASVFVTSVSLVILTVALIIAITALFRWVDEETRREWQDKADAARQTRRTAEQVQLTGPPRRLDKFGAPVEGVTGDDPFEGIGKDESVAIPIDKAMKIIVAEEKKKQGN